MAYDRPPAGGFVARLMSGLLDGWTARHQQGREQQRQDEVYAQQLADKERLAGERREHEISQADILSERRSTAAEASQVFDMVQSDIEHARDVAGDETQFQRDIEKIFARAKAGQMYPSTGAAAKPQDPNKIKKTISIYSSNPGWTEENSPDLVRYIKTNLPAGEDITPDIYDQAERTVAAQNAAMTFSDQRSPIFPMLVKLNKKPNDKFISAEDATAVLSAYGLWNGPMPMGNYSVQRLAEMVVANSQDPISFDVLDPRSEFDHQPLGILTNALYEILGDMMPEEEAKGGPLGYGATFVGDRPIPQFRGAEEAIGKAARGLGSFISEVPGRAKKEAGTYRPASRR